VVVVVVAAGVVLGVRVLGGSKPGPGRLSSDVGRASASARTSSPASPSPGPSTPASFAGTWSGQVSQPPTDTYQVTVALAAGASTGKVTYSGADLTCSGQLTLITASSRKLTMTQGIIQGQSSCENGDVSIGLSSSGQSLSFSFRSDGYTASGDLTRS
jgi:hypothetical protein